MVPELLNSIPMSSQELQALYIRYLERSGIDYNYLSSSIFASEQGKLDVFNIGKDVVQFMHVSPVSQEYTTSFVIPDNDVALAKMQVIGLLKHDDKFICYDEVESNGILQVYLTANHMKNACEVWTRYMNKSRRFDDKHLGDIWMHLWYKFEYLCLRNTVLLKDADGSSEVGTTPIEVPKIPMTITVNRIPS